MPDRADGNTSEQQQTPLSRFAARLATTPDLAATIHAGQIGAGATFPGAFGPKPLVYADYVASGRALRQIETLIMDEILPFYANSHTEASFTGGFMTRLREQARDIILDSAGADQSRYAAIFSGAGATGALNKLVHLFGVKQAIAAGEKVHVLVGPYEHHSNLLPWRESGATVIEISEDPRRGGPDLSHLSEVLASLAGAGMLIGAFSAASNVSGITTDVIPVTRLIKAAGGRIVWDYAGGGPYLRIRMQPEAGLFIDAVALSAHKFVGGPGASGVLIVRRDAVSAQIPSAPGGGTVAFVNRHVQDYASRLEEREEGGTPNILGDIRAALAIMVKDSLGQEAISARNRDLSARAMALFRNHPNLILLGGTDKARLPILSFLVRDRQGALVDHNLFTRMLSDHFGIQARGGCACAGPYVHRLLNISDATSAKIRRAVLDGNDAAKPGFTRLNLSFLMSDTEVEFILSSLDDLARNAAYYAAKYDDLQGLEVQTLAAQ